MHAIRRPTFDLAAAITLSAAVHAIAMVVLASWAAHSGPDSALALMLASAPSPASPDAPPAPDPSDDLTIPISLGIEDSQNITDNWLGYKDPTPHEADKSSVEQPALTQDPMVGDNAPSADAGLPTPEAAAPAPASDAADPVEESKTKEAEGPPAPSDTPNAAHDTPVQPAEAEVPPQPEDGPLPEPPPPEAGTDASQPKPEPAPAESAAKPTKTAPGSQGKGDTPGERSDKESIATALKQAVVVRPGHPAAAQGLDIKTKRPRWRDGVRLTRTPRNPVVRVQFNRAGIVKKVEFLTDGKLVMDTGFADVNEPLLDAVYGWTAKGKALRDLPADKPDATVVLTFRIILVD